MRRAVTASVNLLFDRNLRVDIRYQLMALFDIICFSKIEKWFVIYLRRINRIKYCR